MSDQTPTGGLVQTWIAVADTDGRTRLEAHWVDHRVGPNGATVHATHAA